MPRHPQQPETNAINPSFSEVPQWMTTTEDGRVHIPISPWTPRRFDRMPTEAEFLDHYQRREPFIVSLPSRTPSRPHVPTAESIAESITLSDPGRKQQCYNNLEPFGWETRSVFGGRYLVVPAFFVETFTD